MITLRDDVAVPAGFDADVAPDRSLLVAVDGGPDPGTGPATPDVVGVVAYRSETSVANVGPVWVPPARRGAVEVDLLAAVRRRFADAVTVTLHVGAEQTALLATLQDAPVLGFFMTKPVAARRRRSRRATAPAR